KTEAAFDAADTYLSAQEAAELVRIADASIAAAEGQQKDAEALAKSGRIIRSDLLKINIAAQDAKAQRAKAIAAEKKARERLFYLVGLPMDDSIILEPMPTAVASDSYVMPESATALNEAAQNRLELKQAQSYVT